MFALQARNFRLRTLFTGRPSRSLVGKLVLRHQTALGRFLESATNRAGRLVDVLCKGHNEGKREKGVSVPWRGWNEIRSRTQVVRKTDRRRAGVPKRQTNPFVLAFFGHAYDFGKLFFSIYAIKTTTPKGLTYQSFLQCSQTIPSACMPIPDGRTDNDDVNRWESLLPWTVRSIHSFLSRLSFDPLVLAPYL